MRHRAKLAGRRSTPLRPFRSWRMKVGRFEPFEQAHGRLGNGHVIRTWHGSRWEWRGCRLTAGAGAAAALPHARGFVRPRPSSTGRGRTSPRSSSAHCRRSPALSARPSTATGSFRGHRHLA
eukprot:scaffold4482_cov393-Prasinococcus_capsulatus_cf.AAC.14